MLDIQFYTDGAMTIPDGRGGSRKISLGDMVRVTTDQEIIFGVYNGSRENERAGTCLWLFTSSQSGRGLACKEITTIEVLRSLEAVELLNNMNVCQEKS
ncbi:MAG: hypothetical protein G01um101470_1064 [Parcubacteria group bacterium Gr01-1014_70]|nr:MAG: hypothetical protein G01um101470_1064 [Parcubacteria group bacterium Gr01-1014_70]